MDITDAIKTPEKTMTKDRLAIAPEQEVAHNSA